MRGSGGKRGFALLIACCACSISQARAQPVLNSIAGGSHGLAKNEPVTFSADHIDYDRNADTVTASGNVEAWQNGHVLRADKVTFDRGTGVAAATGHVVLMEPDGEVMFAEYAELRNNMQDAILKDMRALLQQNGKLAANGAQRTGGQINELSKVVYTTCDACKKDPNHPPLWQIKAASAVEDLEHKRIEYSDATLEMDGIPVAYMPYFWHPDPSEKRASGILPPVLGNSSNLGAFFGLPYYWVIDDQSDATFTPLVTTEQGGAIDAEYRHRFNDGSFIGSISAGSDRGGIEETMASVGQFTYDDTWRWGFTINRTSSYDYVRDYHIIQDLTGDINVLTSQFYVEGFGDGAYTRLDSKIYQALNVAINANSLPVVLPRYRYSYFGLPDDLGGRLSFSAGAFNVMRDLGTDTRRGWTTVDYERPFSGMLGDQWKVTLHGDAIAYNAGEFTELPNFGGTRTIDDARALPQVAVDWRWPFARDSGDWGTQLIEPIAQLVVAPQAGGSSQNRLYPNEDSLDFEFTDANLFGFNRFTGVDRLDGGVRVNVALHGAWYLGGTTFDGLIGQSYRTSADNLFPEASGLHDTVSDIVARATFTPTNWLDLTYRTRLSKNSGQIEFADASAAVGTDHVRVTGGYIYTTFNPADYYDYPAPPPATIPGTTTPNSFYFPRNEISAGLTTKWGNYRFTGSARRDLETNQMVLVQGDAIYEDECFIFDIKLYRRYTSINGDNGSTALLFLFTFKSIGQIGYRAM